jgi:Flp pilus assembly protein TadG
MLPAREPERGVLMWRGRAGRRRAFGTTSREGGRRCASGSISVELVVLAPGLALLLLLIAAGARVVEVQGHIDGAARDAARAASIARSYTQAVRAAEQAAQADLGTTSLCAPRTVGAQVAGYPAVPLASGAVTVTVTCEVNMSPFTALGFGMTRRFTGQAVAPLDPFMCRDVAC